MRLLVMPLAAIPFVFACNPSDCQGEGFITDQQAIDVIDDKGAAPLCVGNNTTVTGDVNISTQAQLNDAANCETIVGNLSIVNSVDIVDLSPLAQLKTIDQGYFLALNNTALTAIDLPNLERVAYGIGVIDNPAITAATFPGIVEAFGDITVRNNAALTNVAFNAMIAIRNDARFNAANPLADNAGNLIVGENPVFTGFQNFNLLEEIDGFVSVFANDSLENFEGLEQLNQIQNAGNAAQAFAVGIDFDAEQNIIAAGNAELVDFTGLGDLEAIGGDIFIGFNPKLANFTGLDDLTVHADDIFIVGNQTLVDFNGLNGDGGADGEDDGLQVINGSLFVGLFFDKFKQPVAGPNPGLQDLTGLNNLAQLDGSLVLAFNNNIDDLNGLGALPLIGGDLIIVGTVGSLDGADALSIVTGDLVLGQIFGNDDKVLNPVLDVNEQEFGTDFNANLDLAGNQTDLDALTVVGGDLVVAFANVDNLKIGGDNFTTIDGSLILHNTNLNDLQGLETIATLGGLVVGFAVDKNGDLDAVTGEVVLQGTGNNDFNAFTGLNVTDLGDGGLALGANDNLNDAALATLPITGTVFGSVTIANTNLTTLAGLDVATIFGNLNIGAIRNSNNEPLDGTNDNLTVLAVDALGAVGGSVLIAFNDALVDVGMTTLATVGGSFEVTEDNALNVIDGLGALTSVGAARVHDLPQLNTLNLPGLNDVDDLFLVRNPQLDAVNFNALVAIDDTAEVTDNGSLQNLDFFAGLTTVGNLAARTGDLIIQDNAQIANMVGLNGLLTVGGDLVLENNPGINTIELAALTQTGGSFEINDMEGLEDLRTAALLSQPLAVVGDALRVKNNAGLESLAGLENVTTVGLTLSIVNNPVLTFALLDELTRDVLDLAIDQIDEEGVVEEDDQGLLLLENVGNANFDEDQPTGDRGVVEVQNNPLLAEAQIDDIIADLNGFDVDEDFTLLCGNKDQVVLGSLEFCGVVVEVAADAGEGEGEGEGE